MFQLKTSDGLQISAGKLLFIAVLLYTTFELLKALFNALFIPQISENQNQAASNLESSIKLNLKQGITQKN